MIKVGEAFQNKKAFVAYFMAGDPNLAVSAEYILAAQEAGADLIEIGIPFSDPIAEGEVIQEASVRALKAGTRLDGVFEMVASLKGKMRIPLVFMTYLNPVFVYGYDRLFAKCAELGVGGLIIPDMPFEEQGEATGHSKHRSIASRFVIRLQRFIFCTSDESDYIKNPPKNQAVRIHCPLVILPPRISFPQIYIIETEPFLSLSHPASNSHTKTYFAGISMP